MPLFRPLAGLTAIGGIWARLADSRGTVKGPPSRSDPFDVSRFSWAYCQVHNAVR